MPLVHARVDVIDVVVEDLGDVVEQDGGSHVDTRGGVLGVQLIDDHTVLLSLASRDLGSSRGSPDDRSQPRAAFAQSSASRSLTGAS